MPKIVLTTLNARYIHSALGLRYLKAHMGELEAETHIQEFVLQTRPIDIVESLLENDPLIVGLGVYIWNIEQCLQVVSILKQVRPDVIVVLGGPEVSFEHDQQPISALADFIICGAADHEFARLCHGILNHAKPTAKIIHAEPPSPTSLNFPYRLYTDEDITHRILYVEASRGCPFKCEFCLSALDKTAIAFDLDAFLMEISKLYDRGARQFKFVDRTFNLKIENSLRILAFFQERMNDDLFLHFEVIPDHLPDRLKEAIKTFPPGSLQLEIGIQTFNPTVQALISRKQDNEKTRQNLVWLREHSHAHIHADLIIGLPGEDIESIATGFDQLVELNPHEIQVGILKRLRGTPIIRHTDDKQMRYNPQPPYNILSTDCIDFQTLQRLNRFARYWDMIANSGRFAQSIKLILQDQAFARFLQLSDWLYQKTGQTHRIALDRLFELICQAMIEELALDKSMVHHVLWQDFLLTGSNTHPTFEPASNNKRRFANASSIANTPKRQARHVGNLPNE